MTIFETERLIVRQLVPGDIDHFDAINGDEELMRFIRPAKSRRENETFLLENIRDYERRPQQGRWAVIRKDTGDFAGTFAVIPIEDRYGLQIGYALLKACWGFGYATELTRGGVEYVFSKLRLPEIWAITDLANKGSQKVLEKAGFVRQDTIVHHNKQAYLFRLSANEMPLETERLKIIPLSHKRLLQYLKGNGVFEKDSGLPFTGRRISPDVKDMVVNFTMPQIKKAAADDYLYYSFWIVILKASREIVAELGFKGPPDEEGKIEIGYGTMPGQEKRGYMTEAVGAMIDWAKRNSRVKAVLAETEDTNSGSIRVLQKNNFMEISRKSNMICWRVETE